jgi:hypothetical protein
LAVLPFGNPTLVEVKNEFSWMIVHVLSGAPDCCCDETTRDLKALAVHAGEFSLKTIGLSGVT